MCATVAPQNGCMHEPWHVATVCVKRKSICALFSHRHVYFGYPRYRPIFDDVLPNEGLTQGISRNEVKVAISRMKNGKATGMDGIPVEVWKWLAEEGIDMLWNLMQVIYEQEKKPTNGVES